MNEQLRIKGSLVRPKSKKNIKNEMCGNEFLKKLTDNPDWSSIGERVKGYRFIKGITVYELAHRLGINVGTINHLEEGKSYKSQNVIWNFIRTENLSIRWVYTGEGEYNDADPPEYLPVTLIHERGAGIRLSDERKEAEEGSFSGDPLEFVMAIDAFKRVNRKPFPTWTEVYELFISLGYRKTAPAKINPKRK